MSIASILRKNRLLLETQMARKVRDYRLETREQRLKLKPRKQPYFYPIKQGAYIGYSRRQRGSGAWIARCQAIDVYSYKYKTVGNADDFAESNGIDVLNYGQALEAVLSFSTELTKENRGIKAASTVSDACDLYLEWFSLHRKSVSQTKATIEAFIRPSLGRIHIDSLTTAQIRKWFEKIAQAPKRNRSSSRGLNDKLELVTADLLRKRKSSANRILTVLKALLNHAWREGFAENNEAWARVQAFRNVEVPRINYLSSNQCVNLINSANDSFKPLIRAGLLTGCRYGEVISLRCCDFNIKGKSILIVESKTNRPRRIPLNDEALSLFISHTKGRKPEDVIFLRGDSLPWGKSHQHRPMQEAVKRAGISGDTTFYTLRHTFAAMLAMRGVSMRTLAELLGNSTSICERYYAHISETHLADAVSSGLPSFRINNVVDIKKVINA